MQTSWGTAVEFLFCWTGCWEIPFGKESVKTCYPIFVRVVFQNELQEKSNLAFLLWLPIKNTYLVWQTFCTQITRLSVIWCVRFTVMDLHSLFLISPAIKFCMLLSPKDCTDVGLNMSFFYVSHISRCTTKKRHQQMPTAIIHLLWILRVVGKPASAEDAVTMTPTHCTVSGGAGYLN